MNVPSPATTDPTCQELLDGIAVNPTDDTARLVLADRLDEVGEPAKAALIRMGVEYARVKHCKVETPEHAQKCQLRTDIRELARTAIPESYWTGTEKKVRVPTDWVHGWRTERVRKPLVDRGFPDYEGRFWVTLVAGSHGEPFGVRLPDLAYWNLGCGVLVNARWREAIGLLKERPYLNRCASLHLHYTAIDAWDEIKPLLNPKTITRLRLLSGTTPGLPVIRDVLAGGAKLHTLDMEGYLPHDVFDHPSLATLTQTSGLYVYVEREAELRRFLFRSVIPAETRRVILHRQLYGNRTVLASVFQADVRDRFDLYTRVVGYSDAGILRNNPSARVRFITADKKKFAALFPPVAPVESPRE